MGVKADGKEMGPGIKVTDEVQDTDKACEYVQEHGQSLTQFTDCDVGIQDHKLTNGTGIPLITPLQNMPSQHISGALNTKHNEAQLEHADGGYSVLSNTPTLLRPDANIEDRHSGLSHGSHVSLDTDASVDDACILMEERISPLQPGEIMEILETEKNDDWDAMYNTLLDEITLRGDSALKLQLSFNPDMEVNEEGYTPLYKAALEGHLEGVGDLISRGANPNKPSKGGLRPLHAAAQKGHTHIVDFLILQGADVSFKCELGETPLHTAAAHGYVDILESFIAEGPDLNQEDNFGCTSFHAAVQEGHLEAVKYLMTQGAKQGRYSGKTPLYLAARYGHLEVVQFLISKGTDVNEEDEEGMIPLHGAALHGHTKVIEYLIQQGSDVNKADAEGWTPFNAAVQNGHLEAVKYLMTEGAKQIRYNDMTPLYAAACYGHLDIVEFFISQGANVNEENSLDQIPLHGAAIDGDTEVIEYLIQRGSDVNKNDTTGWTPFNAAVQYGHLEAVKYFMTEGARQNRYDGMTPLFAAAQLGHLDIVKFFVSKGADVNEGDDDGVIPLHGAAGGGHLEVMNYLIQQGSDVNKADAEGWTPFNAAVQNGHLEAVNYLLTERAKQSRYDGMTPLYTAAHLGHLDIGKLLISKGADVNEKDDDGVIPLHGAASGGHLEVMKYLIQQGSDVNKADAEGWTPFNAAIQNGHLEAVNYLLTERAKQNRYDGKAPLYSAARFGHLDIVRFFISNGADVNEEDDEGEIPLHGAAMKGNVDVIKYLIEQGSNVNKMDDEGWTPFNAAVQNGHLEAVKYLMTEEVRQNRYAGMTPLYVAAQLGHLDIVKLFISNGADVNEEDDEGEIPLHGAAMKGNVEVIKYLMQQGCDLNKNNNTGWTPLHAAVSNGHLEVIKVLLAKEALGTRFEGLTPLYIATQYDHVDVVKFFVSNGYDVNERNECGKSPLHAGCYNGNMNIVKLLVHHNANVNEQDHDGWTPLEAAAQEGHHNIVNYLALNGADMHMRDIDDLTPRLAAVNEGLLLSCRSNPDKEETGDPRTGGNQNIITRGFVTVTMEDAATQLRIGQLASRVDSVDDRNDCKQADIAKTGDDELYSKNLPTGVHDGWKSCREENNPFIHAKLKYPGKGEHDPILDQIEAMRSPVTTNDADGSSPHGSQTWQYNGLDPPYRQTMETDGHPSEELKSRCNSLIDENTETRGSSSPMKDGNDLPISDTSVKFESFPTHPPAVVHQKSYDGKLVSTQGTSSNQVWKIGTKRQKSVHRCPSILALAQTFLQVIIALAIILARSPVLVAGVDITERVTLQAGKPGVVPFHLPWPSNSTAHGYFTLRFKSMPRPFCINGTADVKGFKSPSQLPRFTTSVTYLDTSPCVNLIIDNVDTLDEGGYVFEAVWHSFENVRYETMMKEIVVQIPPVRAKCFITLSEHGDYPYEVHCEATTGSVTTTLSCYQNDQKIDVTGDITDNGLITRRIFWLHDYTHFSCCSHDVTLHVNETTCNDFEWPPIKETTRQIVNTVPTSVTTPTPQVESHTVSGACRQSMLRSMWHFTHLFIYILAFVTIY